MKRNLVSKLVFLMLLLAGSAVVSSGQEKTSFTCESDVLYRIAPQAGWTHGFYEFIRVPFNNGSADARNMYCTYATKSGQNEVLLTRPVPASMRCTYDGGKTRSYTCVRNVPPIKIKPKSN